MQPKLERDRLLAVKATIFVRALFLADPAKPGAALQTPPSLTDSVIQSWFVKISLRCRHAQTVKNGASSHKANYIDIFSDILNPEGHQNRYIG